MLGFEHGTSLETELPWLYMSLSAAPRPDQGNMERAYPDAEISKRTEEIFCC